MSFEEIATRIPRSVIFCPIFKYWNLLFKIFSISFIYTYFYFIYTIGHREGQRQRMVLKGHSFFNFIRLIRNKFSFDFNTRPILKNHVAHLILTVQISIYCFFSFWLINFKTCSFNRFESLYYNRSFPIKLKSRI